MDKDLVNKWALTSFGEPVGYFPFRWMAYVVIIIDCVLCPFTIHKLEVKRNGYMVVNVVNQRSTKAKPKRSGNGLRKVRHVHN